MTKDLVVSRMCDFLLHILYSFHPVNILSPSFTAFYLDLELEFHLSQYSFFNIYPMFETVQGWPVQLGGLPY